MYSIVVEAGFSAVHGVLLHDGTLEPSHSHDWVVRACFTRTALDATGMVMDFDDAREGLQAVVAELQGTDLNKIEPLAGLNPTAEVLAGHIFESLKAHGLVLLRRVEVTEAPGCVAMFETQDEDDPLIVQTKCTD
jgi:6-pyruvoyltetrahydropterin/6-carboxytetrahydropterin synthase